jgi:colanic acid/amylovoran biosynthesis glycosyltransferase
MSRRPRLLIVSSTFPAAAEDATPAFVLDLAKEQAREFETAVLVPRVPGSAGREEISGVAIERFGYFPRRWEDLADGAIIENLRARPSRWLQLPPFLAAEIWAIRRAIRRYRPDVLHLHWMIPQGAAALVAARQLPWVVTAHGGDVYALSDPLSRRVKTAVLRHSRAVTAMNTDMRARLVALGADPGATTVLPMGVDVERFRAPAGLAPRVPGRIVFVGRLVEKKGVGTLLEAARGLSGLPDWTLEVVGDGPLRASLEQQSRGLPVTFRGPLGRSRLTETYASAEVAVFPSVPAATGDQDGLPVALLEAMAAGCAVIASDLPGIDTAVQTGVSGLLVPPGEPAALADAARLLLSDAALRERLGRAAAARSGDFSIESTGLRYRRVLLDAMRPR